MEVKYGEHYNRDYFTGRKVYHDGGGAKQLYHGPGLVWDGFNLVGDALDIILHKGTVLDVGCSAGDLCYRLKLRGFEPYGIDISDYAIENARVDMRDRLHICDATTEPPLPPHFPETFDSVISTDFLEHVYEEDLERTFNWLQRKSLRQMFFCVATVATGREEFVAKKGEPIPAGYEGVAVSGHVNVRPFGWWCRFFRRYDPHWRIDWKAMYVFQAVRERHADWRATPGWNMPNTFVLERC